jgi:hypothetical protein
MFFSSRMMSTEGLFERSEHAPQMNYTVSFRCAKTNPKCYAIPKKRPVFDEAAEEALYL